MINILEYANSLLPRVKLCDIGTHDLGVKISEKIVARNVLPFLLGDIKHMVINNVRRYRGIDVICKNGININVKSGVLIDNYCVYDTWVYALRFHDNASDYFLCIGYDNKYDQNIKILHIWLIDRREIGINTEVDKSIRIYNNPESLLKFRKYEKVLINDIRELLYIMQNFAGC